MIEESCAQGQTAFHIIDHWRYITKLAVPEDIYDLGYQVLKNHQPATTQCNTNYAADTKFDLDIYFILVRFLINDENRKLSNLKIWMLEKIPQ